MRRTLLPAAAVFAACAVALGVGVGTGVSIGVVRAAEAPAPPRVAPRPGPRPDEAQWPAPASFRTMETGVADALDLELSPDAKTIALPQTEGPMLLLDARTGRIRDSLLGHEGRVLCVAFESGGRAVAAGGEDGRAFVWSLQADEALRLTGHRGPVVSLSASRDGNWVLSGSADGTARLWSARLGREALELGPCGSAPRAIALALDARLAAVALPDGSIRLFDVAPTTAPAPKAVVGEAEIVPILAEGSSWRYRRGTEEPPEGWNGPGFDDSKWTEGPAGFGFSTSAEELKTVATRLEDMRASKCLSLYARARFRLPEGPKPTGLRLRVLIDDGFVAFIDGREIGRENVPEGPVRFQTGAVRPLEPRTVELDLSASIEALGETEHVLAIQAHNQNANSSDLVLTPTLSASIPPEARRAAGDPAKDTVAFAAPGPVGALAFDPEGTRLLAALEAGGLASWEVSGTRAPPPPRRLAGGRRITAMAFVGKSDLAFAEGGAAIRVWDTEGDKLRSEYPGHPGGTSALAGDPSRRRLLTGGADGKAVLRRMGRNEEAVTFQGHEGVVTSVAFGPEAGIAASGAADGTLCVWDLETGMELRRLRHGSPIAAVTAPGRGQFLSAGGSAEILDWRSGAAVPAHALKGHAGPIRSVGFSADGSRVATASADGTVRIWDRSGGREVHRLDTEAPAYAAAFSPDGSVLVSGGLEPRLRLWDARDGKLLAIMPCPCEAVFRLLFLPDGTLLSGGSDGRIRRWNVRDRREEGNEPCHAWWILGLASGRGVVVSLDSGGCLATWDERATKVTARSRLPAPTHAVRVSRDGSTAVVAGEGGKVYVLALPPAADAAGR